MHDLSNIEASVANLMARAELATVNVYPFEVMRTAKTGTNCNIVGLHAYGTPAVNAAIFVREATFWHVRFREKLEIKKYSAGGVECQPVEGDPDYTLSVYVHTASGLSWFIERLYRSLGAQLNLFDVCKVDFSAILEHFSWFEHNELVSATMIAANLGHERTVAQLRILALRQLGLARGTDWDIEVCEAEAGEIARAAFSNGSQEHQRVYGSLAERMRSQAMSLHGQLDDMELADPQRLQVVQQLEWVLIKFHKWYIDPEDPFRMKQNRPEPISINLQMVRLELLQLYNARRLQLERDNTESWSRIIELAITVARQANLLKRLHCFGMEKAIRDLNEQYAECIKTLRRNSLPDSYMNRVTDALAGDAKFLHERYEENPV